MADYDQAIVLDPKYTAAHANRGCLWHGKGDYGPALADYNHALRLDPKLCPAYNNRAWLHATCPLEKYRDAAKAIDDATKACELSAWKVCWTLGTLAAAYALAGEFDQAVQWQLKAIELAPKSEKENFRARLDSIKNTSHTATNRGRGRPKRDWCPGRMKIAVRKFCRCARTDVPPSTRAIIARRRTLGMGL